MIIQVSAQSIAPILTLYIRHLGQMENLMFVSGLIVSALDFQACSQARLLGKLVIE